MGIRGAWTTFRKLFNRVYPLEVTPKRIGVDMFSLVYTHRIHLNELIDLLKSWSMKGHSLICIWDGNAPVDKHEIIEQRRSVREVAIDNKSNLEIYLETFKHELNDHDIKNLESAISSLSWQGWHLTGSLKRNIQESLGTMIQHIYAPGEADDVLIKMASNNQIDIIMTLDSDLLAMGGEHIWRLLKIREEWIIEDIWVEDICDKAGISLSILQDICFLAGWDRCHLSGECYMPFEVALNRMKYYGSLNVVLEKFQCKIDIEAIERLKGIKKESRARWIEIIRLRDFKSMDKEE